MRENPDDTVRLPRGGAAARPGTVAAAARPGTAGAGTRPAAHRRLGPLAALGVFLLAAAGVGTWFTLKPDPVPMMAMPDAARAPSASPSRPAIVPEASSDASAATVPLLSEAELNALLPQRPAMVRLRENPQVFVLLFPDLEAQGAALNRLAALVEKAGLPRDRLLDDGELAEAITRSGEAAATWYYGHDYPGTEIARFFALADRDGLRLNEAETWLREQFLLARRLVGPSRELALISAANPDRRADPTMRAAILRHEIGHGHFFTRPEVAAHVLQVWRERFTEAERGAFRAFLAREGYDTANEMLMANEAMAYLIFTPDERFFAPHHVGLTRAALERLQQLMREGFPPP